MTDVPRKVTVTTRAILPPPHKAQMVLKGESQGRHQDPGSGFTRKDDRRGPNDQLPASWTDKDCHVPCAITLSPHRHCPLWKKFGRQPVCQTGSFQSPNCPLKGFFHRRCPLWRKVWSPACPLNGSFQSPNCPLKGFFHSPNGIFSRKWPDGSRFFELCARARKIGRHPAIWD